MKRQIARGVLVLFLLAVSVPALANNGSKDAPPDAAAEMHMDADGNGIFDSLEAAMAAAKGSATFDVIVQLNLPASDAALAALKRQVGAFDVHARWDAALNGFATRLTAGQIRAMARAPQVVSVEPDLPVYAFLNTSTYWTGVQQARSDFGVDGDRDGNAGSYSSTDVVVAILDTGIDTGHVDLGGGKVIGWRDEINGQSSAYDDHGHGTHVASIAAGSGAGNAAYRGVAPGAALVGIKVLNSQGSGTTTGIINGINWMINNKNTYNIRIGNMSLGSSGCSNGTDSLSTAVNNASNNGILMMVAAGNSGPAKCTIGSPAAAAEAVTVGASVDPGKKGWGLAQFSSRGLTADGRLKPDLAAPGYQIMAARRGTSNGYIAYSGTSMATPFAAGVAALILDANPTLSVSGVKSVIYNSANVKDWGPAGHDLDYGRGMQLAYNAVKQAAGGSGSFSDGLTHAYVSGSLGGKGQNFYWDFTVTDATKPIGITMIMPDHTCGFFSCSPDFDLYLISPSGSTLASSLGTKRQEQIYYQPSSTGTYRVRVYSYSGSGAFFFDISYR